MSFRRDEHPEELISAAVSGELSAGERAALDAHLASCEQCRATLDAFTRERSMLAGLRTVSPPADLGARVRAGVESSGGRAWWARPATWVGGVASLATVAAALLLVLVLGNLPRGPIGATGSPGPSASLLASIAPSATPQESAGPSSSEAPSLAPIPSVDPNPVGVMEYRLQAQDGSVAVRIDADSQAVAVQRLGTPVNATLSPAGDWVAFQLRGDASGLVDTYAYRVSDGNLVALATGGGDSPFSRLVWSDDGSLLAFTRLAADGQSADAWIFNTTLPDAGPMQVTATGRSFAADFYGGTDADAWLWVSTATDGQPTTDRLAVPLDTPLSEAVSDPASVSLKHADGTFLPLQADYPGTQGAVVAWVGQMALDGQGWHFAQGGMMVVQYPSVEGEYEFSPNGQALFDTLSVTNAGQAFRSARFAWSPDGSGLAVWDADWVGIPQPEGFPDRNRVYFAHPIQGTLIGPAQALDAADTQGGTVIDVSLAGGQYLALTIQTAPGSEGGEYGPAAEVRLVTRNTGDVPDEVSVLADGNAWIGPAFYRDSLPGS